MGKVLSPPDVNSIILEALAFPMDAIVSRYAQEQELPLGIAQEQAMELKKYLVLCAIRPEQHYGMSMVIDELWHTFICFTADYHQFCRAVAGRYIHHQPASDEEKSNGEAREKYLQTLNDYRLYFGEPKAHIWPTPTVVAAGSTCSGCSQCDFASVSGCNGCTGCGDNGDTGRYEPEFYEAGSVPA